MFYVVLLCMCGCCVLFTSDGAVERKSVFVWGGGLLFLGFGGFFVIVGKMGGWGFGWGVG